jgi:hypothetical protein
MRPLLSRFGGPALASIVTRLAIGGFPVLFVAVLRASHGKEPFDLAAAAINWSSYLNVLLLSGFALVPPAVARLRDARAARRAPDRADVDCVRDHRALGRWLMAVGLAAALVLGMTVEYTFDALAARHGAQLVLWFGMFALLALSQLPLTLWLGVAQAADRYRTALLTTTLPRAAALAVLPAAAALGVGAGPAIAAALLTVLAGQALLSMLAWRELHALGAAAGAGADARRVLSANALAGLVVLVGTLVTIAPVTVVGRHAPDQVGAAHLIVGLANAMGGVVVAAYFPRSLRLTQWLREPGGLTRYCLLIAGGVGALTVAALATVAVSASVCFSIVGMCQQDKMLTLALVLAGAGLRLGALGTQHAAMYLRKPHFNLLSAGLEAVGAMSSLFLLLPSLGLVAVGWALLIGGFLRLACSLLIERAWLRGVDVARMAPRR